MAERCTNCGKSGVQGGVWYHVGGEEDAFFCWRCDKGQCISCNEQCVKPYCEWDEQRKGWKCGSC